jgi:phosphoglycerate dehydrogenase-like enzyme
VKIVIAGRANEQDVAALRQQHAGLDLVVAKPGPELLEAVADADGIYIHTVTPELLRAAKKLRWVQSQGAGVEWIANVPELVEHPAQLTNTRGAHAQTIAEHAFAMLLYLTRGLEQFVQAKRERRWAKPGGRLLGLSGMTLGVIGLGRIGNAIAQRGHGFDMRVVAVDVNQVPHADYVEKLWDLDGLPKLLGEADVVAVAIPQTAETRGLVSADRLAQMKQGAYLLVMSRGGIVDERAVAQALHEGRLAGAGLDVFENEPLEEGSPLWDAPNAVLTPHCSGSSRQTTELAWSIFAENTGRFVRGEPLNNLVDKRRGY